MIEIGKQRVRHVRKKDKKTGKLAQVFDDHDQPLTETVADEVWRVTREALGGRFGPDGKRALVVGFVSGDLLALRPQGTRQLVHVELKDVYAWVLRRKAAAVILEKARAKKAAKAAKLEQREWKRRFK